MMQLFNNKEIMKLNQFFLFLILGLLLPHHSKPYFENPAHVVVGAVAGAAVIGTAAYYIKQHFFPTTKVATLVFDGPIYQTRDIMNILFQIKDDDSIDALLLLVECGGGLPGQSEILARLIAEIATKKPVIVQVIDYAGSGGYLMIAPATAIVVPALGNVGCIGVLSNIVKIFPEKFEGEDASGAMEIHPFAAGKYKSLHNQHAPLTDEEKIEQQREIDAIYNAFLYLVARYRHLDIAEKDMWAEGQSFTGHEAVALHLADYVGGFETAFGVLKQELTQRGKRIDNIQFVRFSTED